MNEEHTKDEEIMKLEKQLARKPVAVARGKWEATLRNIRVIKRRLDRIEKLLAIKRGKKK